MNYALVWRVGRPIERQPVSADREFGVSLGQRRGVRRRWSFEHLEPRCLLSALRLVAWNTLNNPNDAADDLNARTVLEAIGNESVQGNAGPVDVLALQETDPPSLARLEAVLDDLYADDYSSVITSLDGGGDATAFIFNTRTVSLLDSIELTGPLTHHTVRARFQYTDANGSAEFYAYTIHLKSGNDSTSKMQRGTEADFLRADAETLGAGENIFFVGDFNMSGSSEAAYAEITAPGEAQVLDIVNAPGEWSDNAAFIDLHTQNSAFVRARLDLQFASEELTDGTGLDYVAGSYRVFGNNGTHTLGSPISSGTGQTASVLSALELASDHLPIVADYEIINDLPAVNLVQSAGSTTVVEGGQNDTYSVVLNTEPSQDVLLTLDPGIELDVGAGPGAPITLTFTPLDALTPRTIVLNAVDDGTLEGNHVDSIVHTVSSLDPLYDGLIVETVNTEIRDDDAPDFVINELDSDTFGSDQLEFIEIYDGGVGNAPLDGLSLVFFNGFSDSSYFALDLDGFSTDANGLFVAGNANVANVDAVFAAGQLQNGADAVALYQANASVFPNGSSITLANLLDAIVYDTDDADDLALLSLLLPTQPQRNEDENNNRVFDSLARVPDGGGQRETLSYQATGPTPGLLNVPPVAGVTLVQSGSGTDVTEGSVTDSYTLVLDSQPTSDVVITVTPTDQVELGAGPGVPIVLTFTSLNWNLPQTILVSAVDDLIAEDLHGGLISHAIASSDSAYASLSIPNVGVEITDNELRELRINEIDADTTGVDRLEFVEIYDGGVGNTSLNNLVVVFFNGNGDQPYASYDLDGFSTDAAGFFVLGNASVPEVDLVFSDNTLQNGADAVGLYTGQASQVTSVTTNNLIDAVVYDTNDADDPGLLPLLLMGGQLNESAPGNGTSLSLARVPDGGEARSTLTYLNQLPTPGTFNITAAEPNLRLVEKRTLEGQSTSFDFALQSTPLADVDLSIFPNTQLDLGAGTGVPVTLSFTPSNATVIQTLTVEIVDDALVEGPHFGHLAYQLTSTDPNYDGLEVEVTYVAIEDNDFALALASTEFASEQLLVADTLSVDDSSEEPLEIANPEVTALPENLPGSDLQLTDEDTAVELQDLVRDTETPTPSQEELPAPERSVDAEDGTEANLLGQTTATLPDATPDPILPSARSATSAVDFVLAEAATEFADGTPDLVPVLPVNRSPDVLPDRLEDGQLSNSDQDDATAKPRQRKSIVLKAARVSMERDSASTLSRHAKKGPHTQHDAAIGSLLASEALKTFSRRHHRVTSSLRHALDTGSSRAR